MDWPLTQNLLLARDGLQVKFCTDNRIDYDHSLIPMHTYPLSDFWFWARKMMVSRYYTSGLRICKLTAAALTTRNLANAEPSADLSMEFLSDSGSSFWSPHTSVSHNGWLCTSQCGWSRTEIGRQDGAMATWGTLALTHGSLLSCLNDERYRAYSQCSRVSTARCRRQWRTAVGLPSQPWEDLTALLYYRCLPVFVPLVLCQYRVVRQRFQRYSIYNVT